VRLLLDTHALLWWFEGNAVLSPKAVVAMEDGTNEIFVSAVSGWEIATKLRLGRLPFAELLTDNLVDYVQQQGFGQISVTLHHAQRAGSLPEVHKDPFDRMLIAQALTENCALVSNERLFDRYGVERFW
jgi:PIN domain nuclease of toxin-antitoxin system